MVLVRDVFRLKFGKAKEAIALWKEGAKLLEKAAKGRKPRLLTDLTGSYYTLVLENTYENLGDFEEMGQNLLGTDTWKKWYQKFLPLAEGGYREILTVVE